MAYEKLNCETKGVVPLIMHNGQTADPLNRFSKEIKKISSKRAKTDADYEELARLEWYASLYTEDGRVCIPGEVIEATLCSAGKRRKLGKQVQAGVICPSNYPLTYPGPESVDALWDDGSYRLTRPVRIKGQRVMRTRAIFKDWSLVFDLQFDTLSLNESQVKEIMTIAGEEIGLCDWRPKFGRFTVVRTWR
jgi:hypothetical protein